MSPSPRPISGPALHPALRRGLRELYAATRQLAAHWPALQARLGPGPEADALGGGVDSARRLLSELSELTPEYQLHGGPAAVGIGDRLAGARNGLGDRFLERNQALRVAVLDVQHVIVLLSYLGTVAGATEEEPVAVLCRRSERRLLRVRKAVVDAAVASGERPDQAIEPLDSSPAGRAAQRMAWAAGTVGEWVDQRLRRAPE